MPVLRIYGRRWYTTSDMLPLPAFLFAIISLVWIVVFSILLSRMDVWMTCRGEGVHYVITSAGLTAVYGLSFLLNSGMVLLGLRGACLEVSKRWGVIVLLYIQTNVWALQALFMIYGTVIMYTVEPNCRNTARSHRRLRDVTHAMIYSTWGLVILTVSVIWLVYNSYQGNDSLQAWEDRIKRISSFLRCREAIVNPAGGRRAPLPSIAQWVSRLFANVDLSPSDLTEACVLTAAAQNLRRKMRIKKALAPALAAVSPPPLSDGTSESSFGSEEEMDSIRSPVQEDTDTSDDEENLPTAHEVDANGPLTSSPGGGIALPDDCPEEYRQMALEAYDRTAHGCSNRSNISPGEAKSHRASKGQAPEPGCTGNGSAADGDSRRVSRDVRSSKEEARMRRDSGAFASSNASALLPSSLQSTAGSEHKQGTAEWSGSEPRASLDSLEPANSAESFLSLSQVDDRILAEFQKSPQEDREQPATPQERFGITNARQRSKRKAGKTATSEKSRGKHCAKSKGSDGLDSSKESPSPPSEAQASKLQANGSSPHLETAPSRALTFESSNLHTGTRTSLDVAASELMREEAELRLENEDGTVVPLERSFSNRLPPVITPSEQVVCMAGQAVPVKQAVEEAVGHWEAADFETLEEASEWARFASAVYAVMPFSEQRKASKLCVCRHPVTEESVRDAVLEIADIEVEDLLYFSHSNTALAHLPYMVALDRKSKTVVVAIRGTMSLADLVTDAVVHPELLSKWLPAATRKAKRKASGGVKKAYAHAGIFSAANSVLEDLEVHGILNTLLQPEEVRRKSKDYRRSLRTAALEHEDETDSGTQKGETEYYTDGEQVEEGGMHKDTRGVQSGGVWPSAGVRSSPRANEGEDDSSTRAQRDEMADAARQPRGSCRQRGEATGEALQKNLDSKGWKLVFTGHSLGAGAAALIGLKLHDRYPDLKVWAFSPPGGLVSKSLINFTSQWCTSVVVGKDVVPRMTVNNLGRLMDEMVTSLARCRYPKLRVLFGGWWRKESRPPPQRLFHSYRSIPEEARLTLEKYQRSTATRGKAKDMFPPGRVLFVRPVKLLVKSERQGEERRMKQAWDAVWISSSDLIAEGILISKKMLAHHSIEGALLDGLGYAIRHHPHNPKSEAQKRKEKQEQEDMKDELQEIRIDGEGPGAMDLLSSTPST